jgi:hypothetical protein
VVVVIMVVVMIVPVVFRVPAMAVLIPPAMIMGPTPFPGIAQFVPPVIGLFAVRAMMLDCLMQLVIGMGNARLTIVFLVGARLGSSGQK